MNNPINDENFNFIEQREAQLTAYALGELDEHERALVERRLEHDAEARAIVAQVRELATTLTAELESEPMPRLSESQREALRAEHPARVNGVLKAGTVPLRTRLWFGAGLAAAACLAIAVTTLNLDDSSKRSVVGKVALDQPDADLDARVLLHDQLAGQEARAKKLYAYDKEANEEQMGLKRQAGAEIKLDIGDKLASAETAATGPLSPGTSTNEILIAPLPATRQPAEAGLQSQPIPAATPAPLGQQLAMRELEDHAFRQLFDRLAAGSLPSGDGSSMAAADETGNADKWTSGAPAMNDSSAGRPLVDVRRGVPIPPSSTLPPERDHTSLEFRGHSKGPILGDIPAVGSLYRARIDDQQSQQSGKRAGVNGVDDSPFRFGVSMSVTDINERITGARTALGIIDHVLADRSGALNQGAPPTQEERLEAELQTEITRRRNEIDSLRAQLHESDRVTPGPAQQTVARLADAERAYEQSVQAHVKQRRTDEIRELEARRSAVIHLIRELDIERERCEMMRRQQPNTETYNRIVDNPFLAVTENPLSTFSIDVDTGSYANVRRFLVQNNMLPPPDAVRIEELINYFPLAAAAPGPESERPFAVHVDMWEAPWSGDHHLARITIKGREVKMNQRPATSLVFLIDVSGSMQPANKLPLLKQSMKMLVDQLNGDDRVGIVTYAGASGLVLPSTFASDKQRILAAIDNLNAGGSTNGAAGIQLAYQVATESFIVGGVNRVILATDGDFNVGVSDDASLIRLIEEKRGTGVHLSVFGFGEGNLKDAKMEQLANHGNGEYAYIDSAREGRKVLVEQAAGTLVTIAKDVKIQIEFNPAQVASYRLIGYENRVLAKEDFNNDAKDAGEIGAGHCVTALYEIVSANADVAGVAPVDALKYQKPAVQPTDAAKNSGELMTIKLRYKQPDGATSKLIEMPVLDMRGRLGWVPDDLRFLTAVAEFGMLLRNSPYKGNANFAQVLDLAKGARGEDVGGYRAEFIELVNRAKALRGQ